MKFMGDPEEVIDNRYCYVITSTTVAVLTAVSAVASAVGSIVQGKAVQKQANAQAEISRQQAERERVVAGEKEGDFRASQRRAAAAVRAAGGARGIDISVGSPLLAAEDFSRETTLQALRIREGGEIRGTRLEQQAVLLRAKGRAASTSGIIGAGSSLLRGATRTASILSND